MDGQNDDATLTNPYMALRAAKIARNQARLRELGLVKPKVSRRSTVASKKRLPVKQTKNLGALRPQRRSARISSLENNPDYKENNDFLPNTRGRGKKRELDAEDNVAEESIIETIPTSSEYRRRPTASAPPGANSVRTVSLDVPKLVNKFLAKPMDVFGKYFVIETSFHETAFPEDIQRLSGVPRLSFNKFSGVQPWKNVVFLWINVGNPSNANSMVNDFSRKGNNAMVTWFGGSKMREDSPVIQNLIQLGKDSASTPSLTTGIIMWCRQYDRETKKLLPYTCLGRLAYDSHVVGSYPVAFTWRLIDYETMIASASTRDIFQSITGLE